MNLYDLHDKPKSLDHHDKAFDQVPKLFWDKYQHSSVELKKREDAIAKDADTSYKYASQVLGGRFPKGEDAISKDPLVSCWYAQYVLRGRFPKGEEAIAKDASASLQYARDILNGRFLKGEEAIAKDASCAKRYKAFLESL